jgi:hypothetical protein
MQVEPGLQVGWASPGALHALLREFAAGGDHARVLQAIAARYGGLGGSSSAGEAAGADAGADGGAEVTPALRAFAGALGAQLAAMGEELVALSSELRAGSGGGSLPAAGCLLAVRRRVSGVMLRMQCLSSVCHAVITDLPPPGSNAPAAAVTAALLDGLVAQLDQLYAWGGEEGGACQAAAMHLLCASLLPLVGALSSWLHAGHEEQLPPDFFVRAGERRAVQVRGGRYSRAALWGRGRRGGGAPGSNTMELTGPRPGSGCGFTAWGADSARVWAWPRDPRVWLWVQRLGC